ncbi:MAG: Do family serine endopeptidase [Candidatus Poribacteria bacterium]|nr:Do family serine endopeptidase [Candidatus Poribacteria bacterium]
MFRLSTTLRNPVRVILVLAVLIVAAGVIIDRDTNQFTLQTAVGQTNDTLQTSEDFQHLERANRAFIDLVARTRPAVVQITTTTQRNRIITPERQQITPEQEEQFRDFFGDEFFRRFFRDPEQEQRDQQAPRQRIFPNPAPVRGVGSGVIVSDDGYILTNNHVIERSDEIRVTLSNGKEYPAELVGRDAAGTEVSGTDLAVLKIDAEGLPTLPFGDSDQLEVGEWVIAIGTPLNFSQTVTRGIVSAKGRPGWFSGIKYGNFIQTDAPINRGNSGGALINIRGELVGINTAIITGGLSTGNIGIGFAVPSKMAQQVLPQLIKHGKVERGWLGISMRNVDQDLAEKLNFDTPRGAFVRGVSKGSPADKAGIQRSDVIVEFNGETIRDINDLMYVVAATEVGKSVEVIVLRDGTEEKRLTVKLGKRTEEAIAKLNAQLQEAENMRPELRGARLNRDEEKEAFAGLQVQNLTPAIAERYGYASDEKGVVVTQVESGSNAEKKGIVSGSLIQEMEWTEIDDLASYSRLVEQLTNENKKQVLLYVKSPNGQGSAYVTIKVSTSDDTSDR